MKRNKVDCAVRIIVSAATLLALTTCGDKAVPAVAGKVNITVLCSSLGKRPSNTLPREIADLYSVIGVGNKEYYPVLAIQRIDLAPTPAPLVWSLESGIGRNVEKMLGTWNPAKDQLALRAQVARKEIGKPYSDEAEGTKLSWETVTADAMHKHRPAGVFALQAGSNPDGTNRITLGGISISAYPSAAALRESLKRTLPAEIGEKLPEYLIVFVGSGTGGVSPQTSSPTEVTEDILSRATVRIHGSNTIGVALAPTLVEEFLKRQNAMGVKRIPTGNPLQTAFQASLPGELKPQVIEISAHGSSTAFYDLARDGCDIGMSSRRISPEEAQACAMAGLGNMYLPNCEHILGLDGIVVIVNRGNPIQSLSNEQLSGIFAGTIKDWRELGGVPGFIVPYARDEKSGTFDTFKALVLGGTNLSTTVHRVEDSKDLSSRVAKDTMGIGFIGRPFVGENKAVPVSNKDAMPLAPNRFTISTEDYPLSRRLYLYTPANPPNPLVRKFLDFAMAENDGQELVVRAGFVAVGQKPKVEATPPPQVGPRKYLEETQNASRVDLNFRFRTGSSELDNKATHDLDRVAELLKTPEYAGKYLLLFGFADSTGTSEQNLVLSKERAKAVAHELEKRNVIATVVTGFGEELPVASNNTTDGKEKNRRVEVWLRSR